MKNLVRLHKVFILVLLLIFLASCATKPLTFNKNYLPEFSEGVGGQKFPLTQLDTWKKEHFKIKLNKGKEGKKKLIEEKEDKKKEWALFWLDESELILTRTWWKDKAFKPSFSDLIVINIKTGETKYPNEEEAAILTEQLENNVERRSVDTGTNTAKSVILTTLSFASALVGGNPQVYIFKSYEGTVHNLTTNQSMDYRIDLNNQLSKVEFTTASGDKYKHIIKVPQTNLYLSPDGHYVYFPFGYLVNVTDPKETHTLWTGYKNLVASCMNPSWTKIAILDKDADNKHLLRITQFNMPEEEL